MSVQIHLEAVPDAGNRNTQTLGRLPISDRSAQYSSTSVHTRARQLNPFTCQFARPQPSIRYTVHISRCGCKIIRHVHRKVCIAPSLRQAARSRCSASIGTHTWSRGREPHLHHPPYILSPHSSTICGVFRSHTCEGVDGILGVPVLVEIWVLSQSRVRRSPHKCSHSTHLPLGR